VPVSDLFDRYDRSEKAARAATQLAPRSAVAYDQLGTSLELKGIVGPETESAYRRAKELDPSFVQAYAHLARLLRRRGMTRESDAEYQRAIDRARNARTRIMIAEVMQSELRFEDSEELLRNALAEEPRNHQALVLLGRALSTQRKFAEAEQALRRAADLSPNGFTANSMLASVYLQQGKTAQAEGALFNAQRSVPAIERSHLARQFESVGDAYDRAGKRSDAARLYRIAKKLNSESPTLAAKLTATLGR
jgi:tetratricopeptide (TPR) repeat protein